MANRKKRKRSVDLDKKRRETQKTNRLLTFLMVPIVIFTISIANVHRYSFVNVDLFPFWYVALLIGVAAGLLFCVKLVSKEHGIWKRIGTFVIIAFIASGGVGSVLAHLNHWFDSSEPVRYEVVIEDKDYDAGGRYSSSKCEFTVTVNGDTFDVVVPWSDYKHYNEGDIYIVEYHEGAFGEPYYIGGGWLND